MRVVALVVNKAASPNEVLPDPEWPRKATFLRSFASMFGIAPFQIGDKEWANWPLRRSGRSNQWFAYLLLKPVFAPRNL
jgi:hypothetical protein